MNTNDVQIIVILIQTFPKKVHGKSFRLKACQFQNDLMIKGFFNYRQEDYFEEI